MTQPSDLTPITKHVLQCIMGPITTIVTFTRYNAHTAMSLVPTVHRDLTQVGGFDSYGNGSKIHISHVKCNQITMMLEIGLIFVIGVISERNWCSP